MKRRGFIKSSMATLAAGTASPVALGEIIAPASDYVSEEEMSYFISKMDLAMDTISSTSGQYINKLIQNQPSKTELEYFHSGLRNLLLVGNFGDLSIKGQVHPEMQKRISSSIEELNSNLVDIKDRLKNIPEEQRQEIKLALEEDPELCDQILDSLELEAKSIGIPSRRMRQMRRMGNRIIKRINHSPDMLINEYVSKCEKMMALDDSDLDMELLLKKQIGEEEYNNLSKKAEAGAIEWHKSGISNKLIKDNNQEDKDDDPYGVKKENKYRKGSRALGIGAILTAVGWIFIAIGANGGGLLLAIGAGLGVTIGPLIILIALFILLVQALKKD